eukprot:TRINITY_DN5049_c1_g1_i1.p1 TRINITY_DN5049_c1_g1~~TRINITY_DN5049_c1_g1_i1.p1  ORF type:complete len:421 (+),score=108.52 TRINITY_DN5049_c1_g1_i1:61-1323(+)
MDSNFLSCLVDKGYRLVEMELDGVVRVAKGSDMYHVECVKDKKVDLPVHRCVVPVLEQINGTEGWLFLIEELPEGNLGSKGRATEDALWAYIEALMGAIVGLEQEGLVHDDITEATVLFFDQKPLLGGLRFMRRMEDKEGTQRSVKRVYDLLGKLVGDTPIGDYSSSLQRVYRCMAEGASAYEVMGRMTEVRLGILRGITPNHGDKEHMMELLYANTKLQMTTESLQEERRELLKQTGEVNDMYMAEIIGMKQRFACELPDAAANSDIYEVARVLAEGDEGIINDTDSAGHTALHHAILKGDHPMFQLLLSRGASPNTCTPSSWTPFMTAASLNRTQFLLAMLEARTPPDLSLTCHLGLTALQMTDYETEQLVRKELAAKQAADTNHSDTNHSDTNHNDTNPDAFISSLFKKEAAVCAET